MNKMHVKKFFQYPGTIAFLAALSLAGAFFVGVLFGFYNRPEVDRVTSLINKQQEKTANVDFSIFWKAWNMINDNSIYANKARPQDKVYGAISGLASSLKDPYTVFMPPSDAKIFDSEISGNFEGVGMEVGVKDQVLTVIAPLKNNPAEKAGVRAGDKILKIDGKSIADMNVEEAVGLIRGKKGTSLTLTLFREGKKGPFDLKVVRDTINIPTVDSLLRPDGIFIISLYNFSANSADLFKDALQKFVDSKSDKLILDLRSNPGGYLDAAVYMASWFLPQGAVVVKEDFGGKQPEQVERSLGYNIFTNQLKMIILVNGGSASASEILSGALQEHHVATLVGEKTFGKGSVQELFKLTPDTNLKITIARWLTPNGLSISEKGITPDVVVKMTQDDADAGKDPQMDAAVNILLGKK